LVERALLLYVEPDYGLKTQENLIADFKERLMKERKNLRPGESSTMMPGDERFLTAYAVTAENKFRTVTADDLAQLQTGTEVSFVVIEIAYKDRGAIHHARQCAWLQPPADPPGIWHFCEVFNKSD